ncbi:MAG: iron ABC transporter permease [Methanocorpusculum sp.]|uniref:FecCD family ABC transporter permease n=1 Tax=Methanocorpusculum sp. TaxID=2058474 RepID=UPI0027162544|nr:iron ABC transporter permease [Methanocorpusculum sp.]MDO9523739.1 iron ABC transporter permease [Methanocorpusculum sp.]
MTKEEEKPNIYKAYVSKKVTVILIGIAATIVMFLISVSVGAVSIPIPDIIATIFGGGGTSLYERIIWNIRIPQALTAIVAGAGLAIAGVAMQSVLRNPLASPFTLGLSSAAAFGAAVGILLFGAGTTGSNIADAVVINNPYLTTMSAFFFAILTTVIILFISKIRSASPETMILAGVAISSLFSAGLMAIQYFVDDTRLASIVFWQFGDVARASWSELGLITLITVICFIYFIYKRWDYNSIDAGEETAKGLGVNVDRTRLIGMIAASLISATVVAFLGIIGFVGLVCPHMMRRIVGDDHRFLIPATFVCGAVLLLVSDTVARTLIAPTVLPVAVITAFLGAPVFLYLIIRGRRS